MFQLFEVALTSVRLPTAGGPRSTTRETEQQEEHVKDHDHEVEAGSTALPAGGNNALHLNPPESHDLHLPPLGFLCSTLIR